MSTKTKNEVKTVLPLSTIVMQTFRPIVEAHKAKIAADMAINGFNPAHPIPLLLSPSGKYYAYGGGHRYYAAHDAELLEAYVSVRQIDHEPTFAELMKLAIADNSHEPNGEQLSRMALRCLLAMRDAGEKLPKPEEFASDLECSVSYTTKFLNAIKRASTSLMTHYLESKMPYATFEYLYTKFDKVTQNKRVAASDFDLPKKYRPIVADKNAAHTLRHIAGYLSSDGKLLMDFLLSDNETVAQEAGSELLRRATQYYDGVDQKGESEGDAAPN